MSFIDEFPTTYPNKAKDVSPLPDAGEMKN